MGRPVKKKYFKEPINIVGYINIPLLGINVLPVHKQTGNKSFNFKYLDSYFGGKLSTKGEDNIDTNEIVIRGRTYDGDIVYIEKLTNKRAYVNGVPYDGKNIVFPSTFMKGLPYAYNVTAIDGEHFVQG